MDVTAGVFYCLGFYILLVCDSENVSFSTHVKGSLSRSPCFRTARARGKVPGMAPRHAPALARPGSSGAAGSGRPTPAPTSAAGGTGAPCHQPAGLSSKAHGTCHRAPLSTVKKGIFNFVLKQVTKSKSKSINISTSSVVCIYRLWPTGLIRKHYNKIVFKYLR